MTKIRVRYPDRVRFDRQHLAQLPISLATAAPRSPGVATPAAAAGVGFVPLGQLASIRTVRSPNELWRENQQPVITVTAELEDRDLGSVNRELQAKLSALTFPPGYRWELAGDYRAQQESFAQPADGPDRLGGPGLPRAGLPVPQPDAADADLPGPAGLARQRPVRPLDHRHAAERLVVHGRDPADRPGREERHHPDRVHRPAPRRGRAAARGAGAGRPDAVPARS